MPTATDNIQYLGEDKMCGLMLKIPIGRDRRHRMFSENHRSLIEVDSESIDIQLMHQLGFTKPNKSNDNSDKYSELILWDRSSLYCDCLLAFLTHSLAWFTCQHFSIPVKCIHSTTTGRLVPGIFAFAVETVSMYILKKNNTSIFPFPKYKAVT